MMLWTTKKLYLFGLVASTWIALVAAQSKGGGGGANTCAAQYNCIVWEVRKLASTTCSGLSDCPIEVCLRFNLDSPCVKQGSGTISHACDNAKANGCVRGPWSNSNKDSNDAETCNAGSITNWNDRCEGVPDELRMCQQGKPGDKLYWVV